MRPQIKSYNGTLLNDTNYDTAWPIGALFMSPAQVLEVDRAGIEPYYAGKSHGGRTIPLQIEMKGAVYTQLDTLLTLFDPDDEGLHSLVVVDLDSVGLDEWTIQATSSGAQPKVTHNIFKTMLYATGSTWKKAAATVNWTVTASGQTKVVTAGGKIAALPTITISPQAAKGGGYAKKTWVPVYNNTDYAGPNYPLELTNGGLNTAALVADAAVSNQVNLVGGITAVATAIPIDVPVGGGLASSGMGYVDTEQISWTGIVAGQLNPVTRGINGTTAAVHADNAVIKRSQMAANGNDWRAVVDGAECYRWLADMNGAASKMWITLSLAPRVEGTLSGTIAGAGAITTISLPGTAANKAALLKMSSAPNKVVIIGSGASLEAFTYTGINIASVPYKLTGVTRAQKGTAMAAHANLDKIIHLENDVWTVYWNNSSWDYVTDDALKPMLNLSTSTNTSWDWDEFADIATRPAAWVPNVIRSLGGLSGWYTDNHEADVFPATEMGMALRAYKLSNLWRAETGIVQWLLTHPFGITTVSWDGEKYRYVASWPALAVFQKSLDGVVWTTVANEATPAGAAGWEALAAHAGVALGATYRYLRYYFYGSLAASADNKACLEVGNFTATLDSTKSPGVVPQTVQDNYHYDVVLTNTTTGDIMNIVGPGAVGEVLTINCEAKTAVFGNGTPAQALISGDWISLAVGANTLQYDETGAADIDLTIAWYDRRKL